MCQLELMLAQCLRRKTQVLWLKMISLFTSTGCSSHSTHLQARHFNDMNVGGIAEVAHRKYKHTPHNCVCSKQRCLLTCLSATLS